MTNKKLWLSLLAIALIVCMLSVGLISCKKEEEPEKKPEPAGKSVELQAIEAIIGGVQKSVEDGDMKDLKVEGTLGIKVNETQYNLRLALDLDLLQYHDWNTNAKGEKTTKKNAEQEDFTNTFLNAELTKGNDVLLGVYYEDYEPEEGDDTYSGNRLYVQYKSKEDGQKKLQFPAPFVGATQNALDGQVDFSGINLQDEDIWDTVLRYASMVAALAQDGVCTDTEASITLSIGTLLDPNNEDGLIALVGGIQGYFDDLDLNLDANALGSILPDITVTLSATLNNGKVTGLDIGLGLKKKDVTITHKKDTNSELLVIKMAKDLDVELSLNYTIGTATPFAPADIYDYTYQQNILDVKLSVDLFLGSALGLDLSLGSINLNIGAEAGYYKLSLAAAADPWVVISKISSLSFKGTSNIINSINEIIQVVESLRITLTQTADVQGNPLSGGDVDVLDVLFATIYGEEDGNYSKAEKVAKIKSMTLIEGLPFPANTGISVGDLIDFVIDLLPKSGEAGNDDLPAATPASAEDNTTKVLQTVAQYLLGAYIGIFDGKTGHGDLYASFDSSKISQEGLIPFSGFTKWSGKYKAGVQYYVVDQEGGYVQTTDTTPNASKTYYTKTDSKWSKVAAGTEFDPARQYYTYDSTEHKYVASDDEEFVNGKTYYVFEAAKYEEAKDSQGNKITSFVSGTKYYESKETTYKPVTISAFEAGKDYYVKGLADGGDFGIGLNASINLVEDENEDKNIVIKATVTNLDIFGLPPVLNAEISNIQIELWQQDFLVFVGSVDEEVAYSTIAGHIV